MGRREDYGYERVRVDIEMGEGYGETGCDKAISVEGGELCVMNEGLEGLMEMLT